MWTVKLEQELLDKADALIARLPTGTSGVLAEAEEFVRQLYIDAHHARIAGRNRRYVTLNLLADRVIEARKAITEIKEGSRNVRLGSIQRDIVAYLKRCGETGGVIATTTTAQEFRGYDFEQVERSLAALIKRGIVRKESIRYILVNNPKG